MMDSWRTTIAGIGAIAAGIVLLVQYGTADVTGLGLVAVGVGLIKAQDAKGTK